MREKRDRENRMNENVRREEEGGGEDVRISAGINFQDIVFSRSAIRHTVPLIPFIPPP